MFVCWARSSGFLLDSYSFEGSFFFAVVVHAFPSCPFSWDRCRCRLSSAGCFSVVDCERIGKELEVDFCSGVILL